MAGNIYSVLLQIGRYTAWYSYITFFTGIIMRKILFAETVSGLSPLVFVVIIFNAILITVSEFPRVAGGHEHLIVWLEIFCVVVFAMEVISKSLRFGWENYIQVGWNKVDFAVVILSLPVLLLPFVEVGGVSVVLTLRLVRFFRLLKIFSVIPTSTKFIHGLKRAFRASISVASGMILLLFISSLFSTMIFGEKAPDMFGNPLLSAYSMFRVFAITGWFEIPRALLKIPFYDTVGWIIFIRCYFIAFLLSGGMIGLSIFNATFIDALVEDNNEEVEDRIMLVEQRLKRIEELLERIARRL